MPLRHLVKNAPLLVKNEIATRFSCPMWLLHQLSGEANAGGLTARRDHTDAAESEEFRGEPRLRIRDRPAGQHGLCVLRCTRHRRTGHQKEQIIQIQRRDKYRGRRGRHVHVRPATRGRFRSGTSYNPWRRALSSSLLSPGYDRFIIDGRGRALVMPTASQTTSGEKPMADFQTLSFQRKPRGWRNLVSGSFCGSSGFRIGR